MLKIKETVRVREPPNITYKLHMLCVLYDEPIANHTSTLRNLSADCSLFHTQLALSETVCCVYDQFELSLLSDGDWFLGCGELVHVLSATSST